MSPKRLRLIFLAASGLLLIWIVASAPLAGQRVWHQGDTWMNWNDGSRQAWFMGYGEGYSKARVELRGELVRAEAKAEPSANPCGAAALDLSKGSDYFIKEMTEFYKRYPQDRDLYIDEVMEQLAKGLTFEQIHKYPFFRHGPRADRP